MSAYQAIKAFVNMLKIQRGSGTIKVLIWCVQGENL